MNDTATAPLTYSGEWQPMATTTPDARLSGKPGHTCLRCLIATKGGAVMEASRFAYRPARGGGIKYRWECSGTIVKDTDVDFWSDLPRHPLAK